jgi:hypothetical protein
MGRQLERASGNAALSLAAIVALAGTAGLSAALLAPGLDNIRHLLLVASLAACWAQARAG